MATMQRLAPLGATLAVLDRGPQYGIVLAVGPAVQAPTLTAGTAVAFASEAGCTIDLDGYAARLLDESEVRAVINFIEVEDEDENAPAVTAPKRRPAARPGRQPLVSPMVQ